MPTIEEIRRTLKSELPYLRNRYHVETLGLFGSYVRSEQTAESDLDVLVDFSKTPDLFEFIGLAQHLEDVLGVHVDLSMRDALKQHIAPHVMRDLEYV